MRFASGLGAVVVTACVMQIARGAPVKIANTAPGWSTYARVCLPCHGARGDGRGPAAIYLSSSARDLTSGAFRWRTTTAAGPPTDADLAATIRYGAPGTAMPAFDSVLSDRQLADTIMLIRALAPDAFAAPPVSTPPLPARPSAPAAPGLGARLWTQLGCARCHGDGGTGDGAIAPRPFDLTTQPLHRPRAPGVDAATAAALDVWIGLPGTAMPGYAGGIAAEDLWAIADHVVALGPRVMPAPVLGTLAASAIAADAQAPVAVGVRPAGGDPDEDALFGGPIASQGAAPAALAPAEASLRAPQCGRCHAKQVREWTGSIHGAAASPGVRAQIDAMTDAEAASCQRCHTPLAEQQPPALGAYDAELQAEGVTCAACHVRGWARRGPPVVAPSLLSLPSYPLETLPIYERADLCMTCHQLPPRTAVAGRPLLDTYAEWLAGPYLPRGVQCQHCHMPNREHAVLGIHDRATFLQGAALTASARREPGGAIGAALTLRNVGAGHMLPTTPTPAVWLEAELVDARGAALSGTQVTKRIGRAITHAGGAWRELEDTRIAPGASALLVTSWPRRADAAAVRVRVRVQPDEYYERFYAERLAEGPAPRQRALYEQAAARARASAYVADERRIPL